LNEHSQYRSQQLGEADESEICCGQVAGLISEVPPAGDVMKAVVADISSRFEDLRRKMAEFF
jgi:NAD(P)H-dependent flavin oxidoreductase YrpB (nitropropane dioxygenase family)